MKFKVALYPSEKGYAVGAPALPGCWSPGKTKEEALQNIADAIQGRLNAVEQPKDADIQVIEVLV